MSDYLNNLVERTLKVAPVVQPRLGSLFESGSTAAGAISRGPVELETHGNHPSGEPKSRAPAVVLADLQATQPQPRLQDNIEINFDRKKDVAVQERRNQEASRTVVTHQSSPLPSAGGLNAPVADRSASPESEVVRNHQHTREPNTAPAIASESGRLIIDGDREENWPRLRPRIRELVDEQLAHLQPNRANGDERKKPEQLSPVAVSTSRANTERPAAPAIKPTPHIIREPIATTELAPSFNVTIGRIDVRAIVSQPSQAPRVARPRQSTTSSLDEYLRKRSEGGR